MRLESATESATRDGTSVFLLADGTAGLLGLVIRLELSDLPAAPLSQTTQACAVGLAHSISQYVSGRESEDSAVLTLTIAVSFVDESRAATTP